MSRTTTLHRRSTCSSGWMGPTSARSRRASAGSSTGSPAASPPERTARWPPVLMTALAMVLGMLPMSLGMGEGGEQNAPLARAVIGGLLLATVSTLLFVPVMYSLLRRQPPRPLDPELDTGGPS